MSRWGARGAAIARYVFACTVDLYPSLSLIEGASSASPIRACISRHVCASVVCCTRTCISTGVRQQGKTSLMAAAYKGHIDIVRLLLDRGADVDAKDNNVVGAI